MQLMRMENGNFLEAKGTRVKIKEALIGDENGGGRRAFSYKCLILMLFTEKLSLYNINFKDI